MAVTAAPAPSFGTGRLFLADSRLALAVLNEARHRGLHRVFGVSREEENLLTFVLALSAASAGYEGARRALHAPLLISSRGAATGAILMREAAVGVAGPGANAIPGFGALMALALVGTLAVPGMRRAIHAAREAEHRARAHRSAIYLAEVRATARRRAAAG
jgi:hypothetical protein